MPNPFIFVAGLHLLAPTMPATDKIAHAAVSANITVGMLDLMVGKDDHITWKQRVIAGWVAWQVGVIKEATDKVFDWKDIQADCIGIGIGQVITWRF